VEIYIEESEKTILVYIIEMPLKSLSQTGSLLKVTLKSVELGKIRKQENTKN